jgi:pyruvate kinase
LGVEIPLQQVANAQKEMIRACNAAGKPCIVATQMLESMTKNPRPTRAEVADVTNAVYDGADVVMTSGETAKGKYPMETIHFMQNILLSAEEYISRYNQDIDILNPYHCNIPHTSHSVVAAAAVTSANRIPNCQAIVVMMYGQASLKRKLTTLVAAYRPINVPIIPICSHEKSARQLMLYRGVRPLILNESPNNEKDVLLKAKQLYHLQSGEPIVIVSSMDDEHDTVGTSSAMKVTVVP